MTAKTATKANISKRDALLKLLRSNKGATVTQMQKATGWQPHSVRGAISGSLKKKQRLTIASEKTEDGRHVYRIA